MLKIKSRFYGWKEVTLEQATECAQCLFTGITTTKTDNETLAIVNSRVQGVQFTVSELRNVRK